MLLLLELLLLLLGALRLLDALALFFAAPLPDPRAMTAQSKRASLERVQND